MDKTKYLTSSSDNFNGRMEISSLFILAMVLLVMSAYYVHISELLLVFTLGSILFSRIYEKVVALHVEALFSLLLAGVISAFSIIINLSSSSSFMVVLGLVNLLIVGIIFRQVVIPHFSKNDSNIAY